MADNYLERRMEDLRSGRISRCNAPARKGGVTITSSSYEGLTVAIIGGASPLGIQLAKDFRNKGANVDLIDSDWKKGQLGAQQSSSTFHLADISNPDEIAKIKDNIMAARGSIDIIVTL